MGTRGIFALAFLAVATPSVAGQEPSSEHRILGGDSPPSILVESDFTGTAPGANTPWTQTSVLDPEVSFGGWNRGPGAFAEPSVNNAFGFSVNSLGNVLSPLSMALAQDEYVSCTIGPSSGGRLDLSGVQVSFSVQRLSWHAPLAYAVFASAGGFEVGEELFQTTPTTKGDFTPHDWSFFLPAEGYGALTAPIELRIYAFAAEWGGHDTSLTAFRLVTDMPTAQLTLIQTPGGTITASPATPLFALGETVQVSAQPDAGFRFGGWSGSVVGPGSPRTLVMDRDRQVRARFDDLPPPGMRVGTNLPGVEDWNTAWQFSDVFKRARTWMTRNANGSGPWGTGLESSIPKDPSGWPTQVPFDPGGGAAQQMVHTIFSSLDEAGPYTVFFEGTGTLKVGSQTISAGGGLQSAAFTTGVPGAQLPIEIHATEAPDHLRNIALVHQSQLATYQTDPFHALFLARLQPFGALRYMDWGKTNNNTLVTWAERTRPDHYTQTRSQGTALEWMIALSNTLRQDAWICIPHMADDDFVRRTAQLFRATLDPSLRVWVEYSNETWNWQFTQATYIQAQGIALGLDPNDFTAMQEYAALRSVEIWTIFEEEFAASAQTRLVKVLAAQSAWSTVAQLRIDGLLEAENNPDLVWPDVLAIAPYFGFNFTTSHIPPIAPAYPTVDWIVDVLAPGQIAATQVGVRSHKAIADAQGLPLVCYEGGQHFVGSPPANNDPELVELLNSANRDPRMYDRYIEYLDMLEAEGVELLAHFSYCGKWSKWGSWGSLEVQDQPLQDAPKYRALIDWIAAQ